MLIMKSFFTVLRMFNYCRVLSYFVGDSNDILLNDIYRMESTVLTI